MEYEEFISQIKEHIIGTWEPEGRYQVFQVSVTTDSKGHVTFNKPADLEAKKLEGVLSFFKDGTCMLEDPERKSKYKGTYRFEQSVMPLLVTDFEELYIDSQMGIKGMDAGYNRLYLIDLAGWIAVYNRR